MIKNKKVYMFTLSPVFIIGLLMSPSLAKITSSITPVFGNYYTSDYESREEAIDASKQLNEEITGEGIALLKNEGNALPLGTNAKISIFGKNSSSLILGGSGSGSGGGGKVISLQSALQKEGFLLNQKLINFYGDNTLSGEGRGQAPTNGTVSAGYNTGETPIEKYDETLKTSFNEFNDAAIVVISRIGGEGFDLPRTMKYNGETYASSGADATIPVPGARDVNDHYLQLDKNESDLIKYCGSKFNKVVVLLNTGSQFETGFLDDTNHYGYSANTKAALWIGYPGSNGISAVAKVLKGTINPSGRTVDTFSRDFTKDPTWKNFGNNLVEIDSSHKGNQYVNLPGSGGNGGGGYANNYVTYKEGIYLGYRYYETRGYDEGITAYNDDTIKGTTTSQWANWYKANVVYPFGHGLSYTNFEKSIVSTIPSNGGTLTKDTEIKISVKVKNAGTKAGKDVVQLYYNAPYYAGKIEKSYVTLGAFDKTKLLNPGEEQTLTFTIKADDLASYDFNDANNNGFKGYELDEGTYNIMLMENSHTKIDSTSLNVATNIKLDKDNKTKNDVKNRFDEVSNYITDDINSKYMSRADWNGTFPTTDFRLTASDAVINKLKEWRGTKVEDTVSQPYYSATMPTTGASNNITLPEMNGVPYTDQKWDEFLDQLTKEQLVSVATTGAYKSGINDSKLKITETPNADGPAGFIYGAPGGTYSSWCSETVLASTWNRELSYKKGKLMGNQALWGNGNPNSKISGWYAPACDIHRSPFSGRNFEYYSEDGVLSGVLTAEVVKGAQDKGLFTYVKHFGLNDQESNRCGLMTWANEQSMREIYFKPFELAVKLGDTHGIMSGLNRIGTVWAGGSYELLTGLLRDEWGFEGCVVTDSFSTDWSNADQMIRAGGNLSLGYASLGYNEESATTYTALRKAAHGILYAHANSNAINTGEHPVAPSGISSFETKTLKTGVVNAVYNENIATGVVNKVLFPEAQDNEITYALSEGNSLPKGMVLTAEGKLTGTPTEEVNNFTFSVTASFKTYTKETIFVMSVVNSSGSIVYEKDTDLAPAIVGNEYSVSVAGGSIFKPDASQDEIDKFPLITYSLTNGSNLPDGLTLSKDGTISGTPTKECFDYKFSINADALGYKSKSLEFDISIYLSLEFETKTLNNGKIGEAYSDSVKPAVSTNEVIYDLKSGSKLPNGLILTEGGNIVGVPTETVTDHKFTVVATAKDALPVEVEYQISIGLKFNKADLADGKVGDDYVGRVDSAQGASTVTYAIKEGTTLPDGLTLSSNGEISGKPTKAGVYKVVVVATSEGKISDEMTFTLYIANENVAPKNSNNGIIIGSTLGAIAGLGIIGSLIFFFVKKLKKNKKE